MTRAMRARCEHYGLTLCVLSPENTMAEELSRLRQLIAVAAIDHLSSGHTVVIGQGECGLCLAAEIVSCVLSGSRTISDLTVITNSLEIVERLSAAIGVRALLVSGEYQPADRCLVGADVDALFERVRIDKVFLSVDGLCADFGLSSVDARLAPVGMRFMRAAKSTIVMADHSTIGLAERHRIAQLDDVSVLITDDAFNRRQRK